MLEVVRSYAGSQSEDRRLRSVEGFLRENFPALAEAMAGILDEERKYHLLPPCGFKIYSECGRTICCIQPETGGKIAFLTLEEGVEWRRALDDALTAGVLQWRRSKQR